MEIGWEDRSVVGSFEPIGLEFVCCGTFVFYWVPRDGPLCWGFVSLVVEVFRNDDCDVVVVGWLDVDHRRDVVAVAYYENAAAIGSNPFVHRAITSVVVPKKNMLLDPYPTTVCGPYNHFESMTTTE